MPLFYVEFSDRSTASLPRSKWPSQRPPRALFRSCRGRSVTEGRNVFAALPEQHGRRQPQVFGLRAVIECLIDGVDFGALQRDRFELFDGQALMFGRHLPGLRVPGFVQQQDFAWPAGVPVGNQRLGRKRHRHFL